MREAHKRRAERLPPPGPEEDAKKALGCSTAMAPENHWLKEIYIESHGAPCEDVDRMGPIKKIKQARPGRTRSGSTPRRRPAPRQAPPRPRLTLRRGGGAGSRSSDSGWEAIPY